jgi:pimeloyl-ACP methyl ester carboxylesterase
MGGGLVIDAARSLPGLVGLVCVNGFYVGARVQRAHRGEEGLRAFGRRMAKERDDYATTGEEHETDPFDLYPLDRESRAYVDDVLCKTKDYDARPYAWHLADSLLRFDVEAHAPRLDLPLLVCHGERNTLHPTVEAQALYDAWGGPKELYWIPGAGHTEFMRDDHPTFLRLAARIEDWLRTRLAP